MCSHWTALMKPLHGRGDVLCGACRSQKLEVVSAPVDGNPYRTHGIGWPPDKPAQKSIAQELANAAGKLVLVA